MTTETSVIAIVSPLNITHVWKGTHYVVFHYTTLILIKQPEFAVISCKHVNVFF